MTMAMTLQQEDLTRDDRFWQEAYEEHGEAVFRFLLRRLPSRDEAEDLLQETFVRAMRFDSFQGGNLRGYLMSIARHLIINKHRRPKVVVPFESPIEDEAPFERVAADDDSPEEKAAGRRLEREVARALQRLKPDHRRAFELAVLGQLSYGEVAAATGWSLSRVKSNVHRARKHLINELGPLAQAPGGES